MIKIYNLKDMESKDIMIRAENAVKSEIEDTVSGIISRVRAKGDLAIFKFSEKFDRVKLTSLEVTQSEIDEAYNSVDPALIETMKQSAANIEEYHRRQVKNGFSFVNEDDVSKIVLGQKVTPIERVGVYVPGGTASYPSSVFMNCIPAKIAGVRQLVMATPPSRNGQIKPQILAAAKIAGVDRIFRMGGAQAIAALAFGTDTIPQVDKIVGPGNAYVAEAKRQVYGTVSIDMIAGPSEIMIISDTKTDPRYVAADMLSQAEHDRMACAVLACTDRLFADKVAREIKRQLLYLPREEIARESIENNGKIIIAETIEECIGVANTIAPEHLELCIDNPFDYLDLVINAGSIFLGRNTPEAVGDYWAGPNHTLPTSGSARFSSPLSVDDFIKKSQYVFYSEKALTRAASDIAAFAQSEGLEAHAKSVLIRGDDTL